MLVSSVEVLKSKNWVKVIVKSYYIADVLL